MDSLRLEIKLQRYKEFIRKIDDCNTLLSIVGYGIFRQFFSISNCNSFTLSHCFSLPSYLTLPS